MPMLTVIIRKIPTRITSMSCTHHESIVSSPIINAKEIQTRVLQVADAERQYYASHQKFTGSTASLVFNNPNIRKVIPNDDIKIKNNRTNDTVTIKGVSKGRREKRTFIIYQKPNKRIKACEGKTKCKNGKWVD